MKEASNPGIFAALQKMMTLFDKALPIILLISILAAIWIHFLLHRRTEKAQSISMRALLSEVLRLDAYLLPSLIRVLYLSLAIAILLAGFLTMFSVHFLAGFVGMILLELLARALCELLILPFDVRSRLVGMENRLDSLTLEFGPDAVACEDAFREKD